MDPNFRRTVALIAAHDEDGATGVVLNRPSTASVGDAAEELSVLAEPGETLYIGGPVASSSVVVLAEFEDPSLAAMTILGDVGLASGDTDLDSLAAGIRRARLFAGHAGWGPGQLEAELEQEAWIVGLAAHDDIWSDHPERLWETVLRRMGGPYALLAKMPPDPSMN